MNAPEVLEVPTKEFAKEFLLGELIKSSTKRFKTATTTFAEMREGEQTMLLRDIEFDVREAVKQAVEIIASDYRVCFRGAVEKVEFKADGVKAALTMHNTLDAHALADVAGNTVLVVIEDASRYLDAGDSTKGEADQKPLFDQSPTAEENP